MGLDDRPLTDEEMAKGRADFMQRRQSVLTDRAEAERHAEEIRRAARALNAAIHAAWRAGLRVDVDTVAPFRTFGERDGRPVVKVETFVPLT